MIKILLVVGVSALLGKFFIVPGLEAQNLNAFGALVLLVALDIAIISAKKLGP